MTNVVKFQPQTKTNNWRNTPPVSPPSYRHPDPIMNFLVDQINSSIRDGSKTMNGIATEAGVSPGMLRNWTEGITRRPQAHSIRLVAEVFGLELRLVPKE